MTNERKLKLFDELLTYVCEVSSACSTKDMRLTLTAIGFTDAEIEEITADYE